MRLPYSLIHNAFEGTMSTEESMSIAGDEATDVDLMGKMLGVS
jgi:hypothetical protein